MGDHGVKTGRLGGMLRVGDGVVKSRVGKYSAVGGDENPEIASG
jgi:hypothetical protein